MDPQPPPPPGLQPGQQPLPPPGAVPVDNTRMFVLFCHLSAFSVFLGIPLGNIFGPLIFWLIKKDESPEVDAHGKESLNFEISITIYLIVSALLSFVLIGIPFLIGGLVFWFVVVIVASVRANEGGFYRYPLTIRFIT